MMSAGDAGIYAEASMSGAQELLERARLGDEEAFSLLFERYANAIFNFIYRMVGGGDVAEELTQETFLRAFRQLRSLKLQEDTKLSTWLFSIAKNVAHESFRSKRKDQRRVMLEDKPALDWCDQEPHPDEQLLNKELNHTVQKALKTLDPDKRLVFTLRVFQQHSYEVIAAITGFSQSKLKADLHRARTEMRRLLRPYLE